MFEKRLGKIDHAGGEMDLASVFASQRQKRKENQGSSMDFCGENTLNDATGSTFYHLRYRHSRRDPFVQQLVTTIAEKDELS